MVAGSAAKQPAAVCAATGVRAMQTMIAPSVAGHKWCNVPARAQQSHAPSNPAPYVNSHSPNTTLSAMHNVAVIAIFVSVIFSISHTAMLQSTGCQ